MGETQSMKDNPLLQQLVLHAFEKDTGCTTGEAAKLLGIAYPRYMEYRRLDRALKPYHYASIKAHMMLSKKNLKVRKKDS